MAKNPGTGIKVGTHFSPRFKRPLDDRFQFDTITEMKSFPEGALYDSIQTYNTETKKFYQYFSTNTIDATLGRWREISSTEALDARLNTLEEEVVHRTQILPNPSAAIEHKVYQYTGVKTAQAKPDHYYECVKDGAEYVLVDVTPYYTKEECDKNFQTVIQYKNLPPSSADYAGTVLQYIGNTTDDRKLGLFYQCQEVQQGDFRWIALDSGESIQVPELPTPTEARVGKIYQYIGESVIEGPQKGYFYICAESVTTPGTYEWRQKNVQPGGSGGSSELERDITANVNVGGVEIGKTFLEGTPLTDVLASILIKAVYQTVTLTLNQTLLQEIGTTLNSVTMSAKIVKGDATIINAKYYVGGTLVDTKDATTDPAIVNGGTYVYTYDTPISTNTTFKVTCDSQNKAGVESSKTIKFIYPYYYGAADAQILTSEQVTTLAGKLLQERGNKDIVYPSLANQYAIFAYDKSYGDLKKIFDENDFDNTTDWDHYDAGDYRVYYSKYKITNTNYTYKFKYE